MILQANNIVLRHNNSTILNPIDMTLNKGELVGLIGPNGAGKTSLLRILANIQKPSQGQLKLNDSLINTFSRKQLAQTIGYLEQGAQTHWPLQARRLVELGRLPYLSPWSQLSNEDNNIVNYAMSLAEVTHLADRNVNTLSGGERLRVLIARMFATQPTIILADEPIAALDPYHQLHTMELLRDHCDRGGSGVVVMHDLNMAARYCHRLILLQQGSIVGSGTPTEVLQQHRLEQVYSIHAQLLNDETGLTVIPHSRVPHKL